MNAERLHAICYSLRKEINELDLQDKLQQIVNFLQNVVNQPNQPQHQQNMGKALSELYDNLADGDSDNFSPAWRQCIEEIGGNNLLGIALSTRIKAIFERNQITPSIALEELKNIHEEFENFKDGVEQTISGLESFGIGAEELEPGECEVGVLIPREAVSNHLSGFGKELLELNFILGTFSELASGKRDLLEIKSISSTDLGIYLAAIPPVAACIAHATEKILDIYKKLLEIRKHKAELKSLGLKAQEMKGITDHSNKVMEKGIENLSIEIIQNYYVGKDENRKNELNNALKISLNKIANRIDKGFNIEVRAEPFKDSGEESEEQDQQKEDQVYIHRIIEASKALQFIKLDGENILSLPEKTETKKKAQK